MKKRVAILISGGGSNMMALVNSMQGDHPGRPCLVVSNTPKAGGLAKAASMNIPTSLVDHRKYKGDRTAFEVALNVALEAAQPDIICLAGFMRVLTPNFTQVWAGKILNIHPSLLPKYKGLNTHARALAAGDETAGCSVHMVTAELDGGPILGQAIVSIQAGDTLETLGARILPFEHKLYPTALRRFIDGNTSPLILS